MKKIITMVIVIVFFAILPVLTDNLEEKELTDGERNKIGGMYVKIPEGTVHYDISGPVNGQKVLLIHGNAAPLFSWDNNVKALTDAGCRVLRFDVFGFGLSDRPDTVYNNDLYNREITGLLQALKFNGPLYVAGTSMGGSIAVYFAAQNPKRVKKLALMAPFINIIPQKKLIGVLKAPFIGDYIMKVMGDRVNKNYSKKIFINQDKYPAFHEKYMVQLRYRGFKKARLSNLRNDAIADQTEFYKKVSAMGIPVMVTRGTMDKTIQEDSVANIKKAIANVQFNQVEGAGHLGHFEMPEVYNKLMVNFFNKK